MHVCTCAWKQTNTAHSTPSSGVQFSLRTKPTKQTRRWWIHVCFLCICMYIREWMCRFSFVITILPLALPLLFMLAACGESFDLGVAVRPCSRRTHTPNIHMYIHFCIAFRAGLRWVAIGCLFPLSIVAAVSLRRATHAPFHVTEAEKRLGFPLCARNENDLWH